MHSPANPSNAPPKLLTIAQAKELKENLADEWKLVGHQRIERKFIFDDFIEAMIFVNDIAALAEELDHHPSITINHSQVQLKIHTVAVKGLSRKDFLFAQRVDLCC